MVDYYLDNFSDQNENENDDEFNEVIKNFKETDDNPYDKLDYSSLVNAVHTFNLKIIIPCLHKIVFIVENYEKNNPSIRYRETLLEKSYKDYELFTFLYSHKNQNFKFIEFNMIYYWNLAYYHSRDIIKFLIEKESESVVLLIFSHIIQINSEVDFVLESLRKVPNFNSYQDLIVKCFHYYTVNHQ